MRNLQGISLIYLSKVGRLSFFSRPGIIFSIGTPEFFSRSGPYRERKNLPAVKFFPMPGPDREFHLPGRVPVETIFSRFFPAGTRQKSRQKVPGEEFRTLSICADVINPHSAPRHRQPPDNNNDNNHWFVYFGIK